MNVSAGFFVRRFMRIGGKCLDNWEVRCRDEAEVLELDTEWDGRGENLGIEWGDFG